MIRVSVLKRVVVGLAVAGMPVLVVAQSQSPKAPKAAPSSKMTEQEMAMAKPGPDPNQPIDEEYTKKIKEYTTEPYFLSPIVDYMPASKTVPTPKAVLGDIAGAPGKLPYAEEVYEYMRLLAASTPRVKVYTIGKTEEGREMIAVAVASEQLMAKLDQNKADLAKLADPRTIQLNDAVADEIAKRAAPVYYITGTIHSTEAGAPTALMEMAYRLAVDDSPYIRKIREHMITLITPVVEVDGRDRVVDLYEYKKKHPNDVIPDAIYWGHYVRHDNNRDAMGLTLKLSQNVLDTYLGKTTNIGQAQVLHDLHESEPFLYDNTIGDGPYNAWLDPILTNEWQMIGWNNVNEMTRWGMPGVYAFGTFDTWSPGYLMFMAATHNGISRLYETFGNGGSADTEDRTVPANQTSRTWYRQNPPLPRVKWSLRNNNNYEMTGILLSENYIATNRVYFLRNFYEKSKRSIIKAKTEGPAAYVLPASDPRLGSQAELLRVLQKQGVEISRATAPFTVNVPSRRPAADAARGRPRRGGERRWWRWRWRRWRWRWPRGRAAPRRPIRRRPRRWCRPARISGRQLHRPHGPAVLAHRGRAARLPVLGAERSAEEPVRRHRLDVPRRLRRAGRAHHRREGARRADGDGQGRRQGRRRRDRHRLDLRDQPQRRQRADLAALQAEGRRHPDGRRAVRGRRPEVQPRIVRDQGRRAGRPRQADDRAGAAGVCD